MLSNVRISELEKVETEVQQPEKDGVDFDIIQKGTSNLAEIVSVPKSSQPPLISTLPNGLPPILPDISQSGKALLTDLESLPIHDLQKAQRWWPRKPNPESLYHMPSLAVDMTLQVERNLTTGELIDFKEVQLENSGSTSKNSFSLARQPGPPAEFVRGSLTNYPFQPGGFDTVVSDENDSKEMPSAMNFETDLLKIPPGLDCGMTFEDEGVPPPLKRDSQVSDGQENSSVINLADLFSGQDDIDFLDEEQDEDVTGEDQENVVKEDDDTNLEEIPSLANESEVLSISETPSKGLTSERKEKWAVEINVSVPVNDFHKKIPSMAYQWPFELDTFQKQAILRLEDHDSVFVDAPTSAGKTVVVEYAIALALRNMT
ncbi:putative helicase SKI2W-like, partial [Apostichopus japonicus]